MVYIPGFLINKVYERGSLENRVDGFAFCFTNRMTPLQISGMRELSLDVDGVSYPADKLRLVLGGHPIDLSGDRLAEAITFAKGSKLLIRVAGENLSMGKHVIKINFITNEYGGATLKVNDTIGEVEPPTLWSRLRSRIAGKDGKDKEGHKAPVLIKGELGGVPLDPDFSRLEAALRLEEPDRVPLFEAEIEIPIQEWFLGREINSAEDVVEFYIRAGYDFVPVLPPFFAPRLMRTASTEDAATTGDGHDRGWLTESEGIIKTLGDVEAFPWPKAEEVDFSSFFEVAELLPPKMKIIGMLAPAAIFGNCSQAMGLENFSYALYDDIRLIEALFEILGSAYVEITKRLIQVPRLGAVFMSDDLSDTGGCMVSPEIYRKYVFPWYKKIGEILDGAGLPFIFHSDGNLWAVLDDLADCGIKAIHPIEPLAMDIVEVKKRYGDRFCIFGNIDLEYTLTRGTVEDVEDQVKKRIKELGPGGGYGLAASNSIPDYVKPGNYKAMVEAVKRYGQYPISIDNK
ncbi:uroporphyrinogen decarboxylase family protein [Thermodesulfobacteriota bacterium]